MTKYNKSQIERHPKRNRAQNKKIKNMLHHLDLMFGENNAGLFLAMICDCLDKMMKQETPSEFINLRTIEIRFNEVYSVKLDCDTNQYVD